MSKQQWPLVARTLYPIELRAWALLAVALGAIEGGVVGVLVKTQFAGLVDDVWLNLAVALVTGAPAFANLSGLLFAQYTQGKDKALIAYRVQFCFVVAVALIGLAPVTAPGLLVIVVGAIAGRVCYAGSVTLRSSIWRNNFPREVRAQITGRLAGLAAFLMAVVGLVIGWVLQHEPGAFRWTFPAVALIGALGAWTYRRTRIRQAKRLQASERGTGPVGLKTVLDVVHQDQRFGTYMACMFVFGSGNLMHVAPLILIMTERYGVGAFSQVAITSSVPLLTLAVAVPLWAKLLDRMHIIAYRARQSWAFVAAIASFAVACLTGWMPGFWLGGLLLGAAYAGGILGWNLGHNDFAGDDKAALYMGVHVTLTGVRGLIAPIVGVLIYEQMNQVGLGEYALLPPLTLTLLGAIGFVWMNTRGTLDPAQRV